MARRREPSDTEQYIVGYLKRLEAKHGPWPPPEAIEDEMVREAYLEALGGQKPWLKDGPVSEKEKR